MNAADDAIAQDEATYQRLVQSITDYAIYMLDVDGIVTTWNAGAQHAKGYTAAEIIGKHFSCFYSTADRLANLPGENLDIARRTGKHESEGWRVRKDGGRFWAHVVLDALRDEDGRLFGFAKITRDCTGQRLMMEKSREHERRFRYLVQSVTDYAIYMLDTNGIVSNWNAGAERAKGYKAREIVGRHFSCFYTPEDRAAGMPARSLATALGAGKHETEGWRVRKDGTRFWAHVVIDPIYDDDGELFGYAKVTRDRTEARNLQQLTRDHERRFRLLVEGVTDYAIYMLDTNGIVSNWNAGAQRAKGYTASEIVGRHFSCFYDPEDQTRGLPQLGLDTARAAGRFETEGWRVRKDGTRFWAHVIIQPIYDDAAKLFGYAKITRDRSEQRKNSLKLAETTRNLDLALDNMLQGICLFNRHGRLVLCNDQFAQILSIPVERLNPGARLQSVLREICAIARPLVSDHAESARALRRHLLVALAPNSRQTTVEFTHLERNVLIVTRMLSHGGWVSTIEDITERRDSERRIAYLAHHDPLTGLPNRTSFHEHLRHLLERRTPHASCALMYLDLDRFKAVNDTLGHHVGDELLRAVARRLSGILRGGDQLARLSGDEFTIVLSSCANVEQASSLADRCVRQLTQPFEIAGNEVTVGVSIGIVMCTPGSADVDTILQQADLALYKAKREGRSGYRLYEHGMNDPLRMRNKLEDDLRHALRNGEFDLHYQPIVDAKTGVTTACEALLRWRHADYGNVSPAEFIPVAEERGLMPEIGEWVLRRACRDAADWPSPIRVSVNVSPAQLIYDDFAQIVAAALRESGLPAQRMELEITETAFLEHSDTSRKVLTALRSLGVGVAMDDFGTGYSSLSLLHGFPFTRIKIDRSFVQGLRQNPKSDAIVRAIAGLCEDLGIATIAEGVEKDEQRDALIAQGCSELQGFLIGRPMPLAQLKRCWQRHAMQCNMPGSPIAYIGGENL
ncbi:EAL domain-containing protein [Paraburkholderia sp.]|uniref:sensor domain-containing protein n=1 Tax=Paraburkholderia sp. TaxID=1926495 RepID=UPI002385E9DF|nr:EAL domain-containing protein [Paraburkholderia sp.]MDE1179943.1 EAL domain-containing protein [Paraburkholderia sp.]